MLNFLARMLPRSLRGQPHLVALGADSFPRRLEPPGRAPTALHVAADTELAYVLAGQDIHELGIATAFYNLAAFRRRANRTPRS